MINIFALMCDVTRLHHWSKARDISKITSRNNLKKKTYRIMSDFKNGCLCGKSSPYQGLCSPRLPLRHYNQEKRINNPVNIKKRLL